MRRRRFLRRLAYVLAALAAVLVLSYTLLLPWFVRRQIMGACESAGIHGVQFELGRITPWRLEVTGFRIGDGHRIAAATADFSPSTLWHKRVSGIRLSGVELAVGLRDGKIDLGPLSELLNRPTGRPGTLNPPLDKIELASATISLQLPKQLLHLPAQGWLLRQPDGRFRVELAVQVDEQPLHMAGIIGPLTSDFELTATGESLDAAALADVITALQSKVELAGQGSLAISAEVRGSAGEYRVKLNVEPDALSVNERRAGESQARLNLQSIAGRFGCEATVVPGQPIRATLTVAGGGFGVRSAAVNVEGISGTIRFDDLAKLLTAADQKLEVAKLTKGKMQLADGSANIRLEGPELLTIARTQWTWLGGRVWAEKLRLNPSHLVLDTTIQLADVDLAQLLDELAGDSATGQGTVSGHVPIVIDPQGVRFGDGLLEGSAGGTLRIKKLEALAAELDQAGGGLSANAKVLVVEALSSFRYDMLQARLGTDKNGRGANVHIVGRGQAGGRGRVDLEIPIHEFADLVDLYLGFQRKMQGE